MKTPIAIHQTVLEKKERKKERKSASWISVIPPGSWSINAREGRNRSCFPTRPTLSANHRESFSEQRVTSNEATCKNVRIVNENSLEMQRFCLPPPPSPPPRRQLAGSTNTRCGQMVMKERSRIPREVRAPLPFPPPFFKTGSLGDPVPRARAYPSRFSPLPSFERRKGEGSLPHRAACFSSRYFSFSSTPRGERHRCGRKKERKRKKGKKVAPQFR